MAPPIDALRRFSIEAGMLMRSLPHSLALQLAESIGRCDASDWENSRAAIVHAIPQAHHRGAVTMLLDAWGRDTASISPASAAAIVVAAAEVESAHREYQAIEVVWTGPDAGVIPLRRTEQAILQIINAAARKLTVVSYAVYSIPRITDALVSAADRGCSIDVIVESPDRLETENTYNTLAALGTSVRSCCSVYLWPLINRTLDANGKHGILHVKCVVADDRWLFLSSANLTEYAFTINMELGVLITGGSLPERISEHFAQLIRSGVLQRP